MKDIVSCPKPVKEVKAKKKPKGKSDERKLIEAIDAVDSTICLLSAGFTCMMCGGLASQLHHFFSKKSHAAIRFDQSNHCPLCYGCHMFRVHSAGDTEGLRDKLIEKIGSKEFESMKQYSKSLAERGLPYLRDHLEYKEEKLLDFVEDITDTSILGMLSKAAQERIVKIQKKFSVGKN
jgi:hypothetical protein